MVQTRRRKAFNKGVTTRGGSAMEVPKEPERSETVEKASAASIKVNIEQMMGRLNSAGYHIVHESMQINKPFRSNPLRRR